MAAVNQKKFNQQIYTILVLSIVLLLTHATEGRVIGGVGGGAGVFVLPTQSPMRHKGAESQVQLTELLTGANDNGFYNELQKYREIQPNYLAKWPGLRDLLLTANDYDEENSISSDMTNSRFFERLRQLADNSAGELFADARDGDNNGGDGDSSSSSNTNTNMHNLTPNAAAIAANTFKEHGTKKNAQYRKQYMSPCHFKICNMGRKRNALIFDGI